MKPIIYHYARCSKSRQALSILEDKNIQHEVRYYLEQPLSEKEVRALHKKLNVSITEMVRTKDAAYKDLFAGEPPTEDELIQAIVEHPVLLQRPIVEVEAKAIIARPPERLLEVL